MSTMWLWDLNPHKLGCTVTPLCIYIYTYICVICVYCKLVIMIYGYISTYDWKYGQKHIFAPKRAKGYVSSRTYILNENDAGIRYNYMSHGFHSRVCTRPPLYFCRRSLWFKQVVSTRIPPLGCHNLHNKQAVQYSDQWETKRYLTGYQMWIKDHLSAYRTASLSHY